MLSRLFKMFRTISGNDTATLPPKPPKFNKIMKEAEFHQEYKFGRRDFRNFIFENVNFQDIYLRGIDFRGSDFRMVNLHDG